MKNCTYCNGYGWCDTGDGMVYECYPCKSTGLVQSNSRNLSDESSGKDQEVIKALANPFLFLRKYYKRD